MQNSRHSLWTKIALLGVLLAAGCGGKVDGDAGRQKVYRVKGKITMGGGPVANASVSFSPRDKQPAATARTGADGSYSLTTYDGGDGAAAGDYVVLVTKSAPAAGSPARLGSHDPNNIPNANAMHSGPTGAGASSDSGSLLPEKYSRADQSDLTATVKPDAENEFNFELKP